MVVRVHKTFNGFRRRLSQISIQIEGNANATKKRVAIAVADRVVAISPVDTGLFKGSWTADSTGGGGVPVMGSVNDKAGATTLARIRSRVQAVSKGRPIHLHNEQPYGTELNNGKSRQAQPGFVQMGVQAGVVSLIRAKLIK